MYATFPYISRTKEYKIKSPLAALHENDEIDVLFYFKTSATTKEYLTLFDVFSYCFQLKSYRQLLTISSGSLASLTLNIPFVSHSSNNNTKSVSLIHLK